MITVSGFELTAPHAHQVSLLYNVSEEIQVYDEGTARVLSRLFNHLHYLFHLRIVGGETAFMERLESELGRLLSAYVAILRVKDAAMTTAEEEEGMADLLAQIADVPHYGFEPPRLGAVEG